MQRVKQLSFSIKLLAVLALTLAALAGAQYHLISGSLWEKVLAQSLTEAEVNAQNLARAGKGATEGERLDRIGQLLAAIVRRPGNISGQLIDHEGVIRASGRHREVGRQAPETGMLTRTLNGQRSVRERSAGDEQQFVYAIPVEIDGERFMYLLTRRGEFLSAEISELRSAVAPWIFLALPVGLMLFYLLGGRRLDAAHRLVAGRSTLDGLTGLGNHRAFQGALAKDVSLSRRHGEPLSLLLIDIDDFKFANDRHGHRYGDRLLNQLTEVIAEGRTEDLAFRIGGDEFAVLMPKVEAAGAMLRARRLLGRAEKRGLRLSLGVAGAEGELTSEPEQLWREAEAALAEAQCRGGAQAVAYGEIAEQASIVTIDKVRALRSLLEEASMGVQFQPIWDLRTKRPLAYEALARPDARFGFEGPGEAFEVAEQLGRAPELDELCRREIFARAAELPEDALLFINVSPPALERGEWSGAALRALAARYGISPNRIVLELTERSSARLLPLLTEARALRDHGFRLALDDVGAGNSGLEILRQLDVEFVKIDRAVVAGAVSDPGARAVLVAVQAFARQYGSYAIAEGVETPEILRLITELSGPQGEGGIDGAQGFLLGRPADEPWLDDALPAPARVVERPEAAQLRRNGGAKDLPLAR
ncbi:MAG: EAL domain-containing protein [Solirubrobacterales bacterium]